MTAAAMTPVPPGGRPGFPVVVVGATGVIGAAVTRRLSAAGSPVLATARSRGAELDALAAGLDGVTTLHPIDLGCDDHRRRLLEAAARHGMQGLIITPGAFIQRSAADTSADDLHDLLVANLLQPWRLLLEAGPLLRAAAPSHAVLFTYHDVAAIGPRRMVAGYAASKAALEIMVRSLALQWRPLGVAVHLVAPGVITAPPEGATAPHPASPRATAQDIADEVRRLFSLPVPSEERRS